MKKWQWAMLGLAALVFLRPGRARAASASRRGSDTALEVALSIPEGGTYKMTGTGVPFDVVHKQAVILPKGDTVYCSGFTFATVMEAARRRGLLESKTVPQVRQFQREWYGVVGEREQLSGPAMQNLGIGGPVSHDDAVPGDFVQLWRSSNGHSVVFLEWVKDASGRKIGFKYRSAQGATGVSNRIEKFSDAGGSVIRSRTYFSRLA